MAESKNTLCLDKFYPEKDLMITDIDQQSDKIIIQMKSTSSSCKCTNKISTSFRHTTIIIKESIKSFRNYPFQPF